MQPSFSYIKRHKITITVSESPCVFPVNDDTTVAGPLLALLLITYKSKKNQKKTNNVEVRFTLY